MAWWQLWGEGLAEHKLADAVRQVPEGPAVPPMQPLTGRRLASAARQSTPGKAPGGDGWSLKRMRQWPAGAWRAIATLIDAVEHLGRWPEALRGGIICLTPKNGVQASVQNPLEARPIVLLAQRYR